MILKYSSKNCGSRYSVFGFHAVLGLGLQGIVFRFPAGERVVIVLEVKNVCGAGDGRVTVCWKRRHSLKHCSYQRANSFKTEIHGTIRHNKVISVVNTYMHII